MTTVTWKKNKFSINYSNIGIETNAAGLIESIDDTDRFCYCIDILDEDKAIFNARSYDFSKIQHMPDHIDHVVNIDEKDMFLYENFEQDGFHRKQLYYFTDINDILDFNSEYFYKIEKTITYIKQIDDVEYRRYEEYTLTIGHNTSNKNGYNNGETFGSSIFIKHLCKEDLLSFKDVANSFCKLAIEEYNEELKKVEIKCPECEQNQSYLNSINEVKHNNGTIEERFKCVHCNHELSIDEANSFTY